MAAHVKKPIIYRGRTYKIGDPISAAPDVMKEWLKNGIVSGDSIDTESPQTVLLEGSLREAISRIEELEGHLYAANVRIKELEGELAGSKDALEKASQANVITDPESGSDNDSGANGQDNSGAAETEGKEKTVGRGSKKKEE